MNGKLFSWKAERVGKGGIRLRALGASLILAYSRCLYGQTTASGDLDLESISANTLSGSLTWSGIWSITALSSVFSTDGGPSTDFQTGLTTASAAASVLYSSAHSSAGAPNADLLGLVGHVDGLVTLPGDHPQLGSVGDSGNFSSLQTTFTISGGPAELELSATLSSLLNAIAAPNGEVLRSDSILNVTIDGTPLLFFSDLVTANPGDSVSSAQNPVLTGSLDLESGEHNFFIELDTEQQALTVPEQGESWLLLLVGCAGLATIGARIRKQHP